MIRAALAGALGAALGACTPIFPIPDAGTILGPLGTGDIEPPLGVASSNPAADGSCRVRIDTVLVISTNPDAGVAIVGKAFLNYAAQPPASTRNSQPLPLFSQVAFQLVPDSVPPTYTLPQTLQIGLDPLVSWLFSRNDSRTNYLTLFVTDGESTLQLIWGLDLVKCDPRPL
jgi:hypothetical protein